MQTPDIEFALLAEKGWEQACDRLRRDVDTTLRTVALAQRLLCATLADIDRGPDVFDAVLAQLDARLEMHDEWSWQGQMLRASISSLHAVHPRDLSCLI